MSNTFGELWNRIQRTLENPMDVPPSVDDICQNRHKGNEESRAAFDTIKGTLSVQQERVLRAIRDSDTGLTVDEIAVNLGATPNQISGRASELKRQGRIIKAGTRLTRSGCSAAILQAL